MSTRREAEQEAIRRFLEERGVTKCPPPEEVEKQRSEQPPAKPLSALQMMWNARKAQAAKAKAKRPRQL